jgi:hypothetical protein
MNVVSRNLWCGVGANPGDLTIEAKANRPPLSMGALGSPNFVWSLVALVHFMRLSLQKAAIAVVVGGSVHEIRVRAACARVPGSLSRAKPILALTYGK